jgi:hypothetical protein
VALRRWVTSDISKECVAFVFNSTSTMQNGLVRLKMKASGFFDTPVTTYRATQLHIAEDWSSVCRTVGAYAWNGLQLEG